MRLAPWGNNPPKHCSTLQTHISTEGFLSNLCLQLEDGRYSHWNWQDSNHFQYKPGLFLHLSITIWEKTTRIQTSWTSWTPKEILQRSTKHWSTKTSHDLDIRNPNHCPTKFVKSWDDPPPFRRASNNSLSRGIIQWNEMFYIGTSNKTETHIFTTLSR